MSMIEAAAYTPADLLAIPDSNNVELVNGELVEKPGQARAVFAGTSKRGLPVHRAGLGGRSHFFARRSLGVE